MTTQDLTYEEMELNEALSGAHTTPQVFIDDQLIGSADNLEAYFC